MNNRAIKQAVIVLLIIGCALAGKAQSYSVGNTSVTVDVNEQGNATAMIPVFCPPGRMGMQPEVSISYSSGSGEGLLGMNMALSGTSVITRTGRNYHLDGVQEGLVFDSKLDNFELDGNRLIWVGGAAHGEPGSIYRTEADQFTRITFYGDYFTAALKDGGMLFYGSGGNSRLVSSGGSSTQAMAYYLYRKYDIDGNYLEYEYQMPGGQIRLAEIRYTGFDCTLNGTRTCSSPAASAPYNRITFTYKAAVHPNKLWVKATSLQNDKVLEKIEVYQASAKVREYALTYASTALHDYLTSVQEKNGAGELMQPVSFDWKTDGSDLSVNQRFVLPTGVSHADHAPTYAGDFNGDGRSDLLLIMDAFLPSKGYRLSSGSGYRIYSTDLTGRNIAGKVLNHGQLLSSTGSTPVNNISNVLVGDVNQDGLDDLVLQTTDFSWHGNGSMSYEIRYHAMIARIDGAGALQFDVEMNYFAATSRPNVWPQYSFFEKLGSTDRLIVTPYLADTDGDGLPDLVEIAKKQEDNGNLFFQYMLLTYGHNRSVKYEPNYPASGTQLYSELLTDFNGNGKTDIMLVFGTFSDVIEATAANAAYRYLYHSGGFPQGLYHKAFHTGDFNGDGLTDLLYYSDHWTIAYATGTGWDGYDASALWGVSSLPPDHGYAPNHAGAIDPLPWKAGLIFQVGDYNGDGKADILERHFHTANINGHTANERNIFYSTGYGFHKVVMSANPNTTSGFDYAAGMVADFDGDGKADVFSREYSGGALTTNTIETTIEYMDGWLKRIEQIRPNLTSAHRFTFRPLPRSLQFTQNNSISFDQTVALVSKRWITEEYRHTVDGTAIDNTYKYYYYHQLFHSHGRGMMGFLKTAVVDMKPELSERTAVVTEYKQDPGHTYKLQPYSVVTLEQPDVSGRFVESGKPVTRREYSWFSVRTIDNPLILQQWPQAKNIHFQYASKVEEWDYLKAVRKMSCFEYDINGNLLLTKTVHYVPGNYTEVEHITTTHNQFEQKGSWLPSVLKKTKTTALRYEGTNMLDPYTTQAEMISNGRNKIIQAMKHTDNLALYVSSFFSYDGYGNLLTEKVDYNANTSGNPLPVAAYTYTSNGRFMSASHNALGQETQYVFEPVYGNRTSETTAAGLTTTYVYDSWGRHILTTTPEGNEASVTRTWSTTPLPEFVTMLGCAYEIKLADNLGSDSREYYDNAGRKIATRSIGFGGAFVYTDVQFDANNRVNKVSNSYYAAADKIYTETEHDLYGRVSVQLYNGVRMAAYQYDKTAVTVTTTIGGNNVEKTTTSSATGHTVSVKDNGGEITYRLGAHNLPLSISTNGSVTTMAYNAALQQTQLCDPDAGCIAYEYDALGRLTRQTDARGNQASMEYDIAGRLTTKTRGDDEYKYTFYSTPGEGRLNKLHTAELMNGRDIKHSITYDYGNKGELLSTAEEAPGSFTSRTTSYAYDAQYRLQEVTYPNIKLGYTYGAASYLTDITLLEKGGREDNTVLWSKTSALADGRTVSVDLGNGFRTTSYFDSHLQLAHIQSAKPYITGPWDIAFNTAYTFEVQSGNLIDKTDHTSPVGHERFEYDRSDRLTGIVQMDRPAYGTSGFSFPYFRDVPYYTYEIAYGNNGNITGKFDAGSYEYNGTKPHAVSSNTFESAQLVPRITPAVYQEEQQITYNSFNKVSTISQEAATGSNLPVEISFAYGVDEQRIEMEITENHTSINHTYYIGSAGMEVVNTDEITYIYAEGQPIAMHRLSDNSIYYLHTDYQGSLVAISHEDGRVAERRSYDAWGRPRHIDNYEYQLASPFGGTSSNYTLRGYTFHEHLEMVGLINMNGRMYDAVLGRMLSPDTYVQEPGNTQSFNRYSYCLNNPTKYTDPDGQWAHLVVGALIGGAVNLIMNANNVDNFWQGSGYFGVGAVAGALGAGVGSGISSAIAGGSFGTGFVGSSSALTAASSFTSGGAIGGGAGFSSGFTTGFGNGLIGGKRFNQTLISGLKAGAIAGVSGAAIGGLVGGIDAYRDDRNFWTGGEKAKVYFSPVSNNFGKQNGECALRCFEEFSNSYGLDQYDYQYWLNENGNKLGVSPNDIKDLVNRTNVFSSDRISPDIHSITDALAKDQRVLMGFNTDKGGAHAVMVNKVKVWPSGRYRVWFAETSPVRIAPFSTSDLFDLGGAGFWTFFPR
jgi:RHS repeat-associated protein